VYDSNDAIVRVDSFESVGSQGLDIGARDGYRMPLSSIAAKGLEMVAVEANSKLLQHQECSDSACLKIRRLRKVCRAAITSRDRERKQRQSRCV